MTPTAQQDDKVFRESFMRLMQERYKPENLTTEDDADIIAESTNET